MAAQPTTTTSRTRTSKANAPGPSNRVRTGLTAKRTSHRPSDHRHERTLPAVEPDADRDSFTTAREGTRTPESMNAQVKALAFSVDLTLQHTNHTVLVEGPEIMIRPRGTHRVVTGGI